MTFYLSKVDCRFSIKHRSNIEFEFDPLMPIVFDSFTGRSWKRAQPDFDDSNTTRRSIAVRFDCECREMHTRGGASSQMNELSGREPLGTKLVLKKATHWHNSSVEHREKERAHSEIIREGKLFVPRWTVLLFAPDKYQFKTRSSERSAGFPQDVTKFSRTYSREVFEIRVTHSWQPSRYREDGRAVDWI